MFPEIGGAAQRSSLARELTKRCQILFEIYQNLPNLTQLEKILKIKFALFNDF